MKNFVLFAEILNSMNQDGIEDIRELVQKNAQIYLEFNKLKKHV